MKMPLFKSVSDCGLLVEFGSIVDDDLNRQVIALDLAITNRDIVGIREVVPALVNLLIIFDPLQTNHENMQSAVKALFPLEEANNTQGKKHVLNVCYDDGLGPDLEAVAKACDMSVDAVINAHVSAEYRVSMYGFASGYAYLSGVPKNIQVPRKMAALRDIPTGSILIAGPQCLTTTMKMPTGWSIIGRSDAEVITGKLDQPFLFDVGDSVTFKRVGCADLNRTSQ